MTLPPLPAVRAAVTWNGPGQPITLTLYGADGEVALPLLPKRALTLAQELQTRGAGDQGGLVGGYVWGGCAG